MNCVSVCLAHIRKLHFSWEYMLAFKTWNNGLFFPYCASTEGFFGMDERAIIVFTFQFCILFLFFFNITIYF